MQSMNIKHIKEAEQENRRDRVECESCETVERAETVYTDEEIEADANYLDWCERMEGITRVEDTR